MWYDVVAATFLRDGMVGKARLWQEAQAWWPWRETCGRGCSSW